MMHLKCGGVIINSMIKNFEVELCIYVIHRVPKKEATFIF